MAVDVAQVEPLDMDGIYNVFNDPRPRPIGNRVRVTEEVYLYFLNILPPIYCNGGFMIVEDDSDTPEGTVRSKFTQIADGYFHEWVLHPRRQQ